jgi:hypothetical protein
MFSDFPSFEDFYPEDGEPGLSEEELREECRAKGHKEPDYD